LVRDGQVNVWEKRVKLLKEEGGIGGGSIFEIAMETLVEFVSVFGFAIGTRVDEFGFLVAFLIGRIPVSITFSLVFVVPT
jgi:hypothetical protein